MKNDIRLINRTLQQDLRLLIADAKRGMKQAKSLHAWSEVATSQAYINGLEQAIEVVKGVMEMQG